MIRHTAHPVAFATGIPGDRGEIGVKLWSHVRIKECIAILCAKDDMNDYEA
jgi:hypothetical protein